MGLLPECRLLLKSLLLLFLVFVDMLVLVVVVVVVRSWCESSDFSGCTRWLQITLLVIYLQLFNQKPSFAVTLILCSHLEVHLFPLCHSREGFMVVLLVRRNNVL